MICIYDQGKMLFNGAKDMFVCPDCEATLKLYQHDEMKNIENLIKYDIDGETRKDAMKEYNNDGIKTAWSRGHR